MRETDRDIRDRIEALKLALREGARERRPRSKRKTEPAESPLALDDLICAREVESTLGRCLVLEKDAGGLVDPVDVGTAVAALTASERSEVRGEVRGVGMRGNRSQGLRQGPGGGPGGGAEQDPKGDPEQGPKGGPEQGPKGDPGQGPGGPAPRYIFLDLETTGFSSTPLFLAGTLFERDGALVCSQLLARDYSEEPALVGMLDRLISDFDICITFNGKSFDMPYLRERAKYHRLDLVSDPEHLDLLHHARRKWGQDLPNCRLTTLEWHILGRRRGGDVLGWEVPCIYHEFVHTDDARRLMGVIRHNLLDVVSMAELLICLAEA